MKIIITTDCNENRIISDTVSSIFGESCEFKNHSQTRKFGSCTVDVKDDITTTTLELDTEFLKDSCKALKDGAGVITKAWFAGKIIGKEIKDRLSKWFNSEDYQTIADRNMQNYPGTEDLPTLFLLAKKDTWVTVNEDTQKLKECIFCTLMIEDKESLYSALDFYKNAKEIVFVKKVEGKATITSNIGQFFNWLEKYIENKKKFESK